MMWSSSVRSILKGWLGVTVGDDDDDDSVLRRSSAVTTGDSLEAPPAAAEVQGSKSYMEVSMSAKRMSSNARSVRNPDEEDEEEEDEEEEQEEGEEPKPEEGGEELEEEEVELTSKSPGGGSVSMAMTPESARLVPGLRLWQSLGSEGKDSANEGTRAGL